MFIAASILAALLSDLHSEPRPRRRKLDLKPPKLPSFDSLRKRFGEGTAHDFDELVDEIVSYEEVGRREAKAQVWETLEDRYWEAEFQLARLPDPIPLYRVITAKDLSTVNLEKPGIFWSFDPEAAEAHWGNFSKGFDKFMLVALVPHKDVHWTGSMLANISIPEEKEITVKEHAKIRVVRIIAKDRHANPIVHVPEKTA